MTITINSVEEIISKLENYLTTDVQNNINNNPELNDEEKVANMVLLKRKIRQEAEALGSVVFKAYEI